MKHKSKAYMKNAQSCKRQYAHQAQYHAAGEKEREKGKKDRERERGTWLHRIDPLFNGMGLTPGLDECLCKHLHAVHHPPIALQRLIVQSLSYRLLFHWPV